MLLGMGIPFLMSFLDTETFEAIGSINCKSMPPAPPAIHSLYFLCINIYIWVFILFGFLPYQFIWLYAISNSILLLVDKLSKFTKSDFHSLNNENNSTECDHLNKIYESSLKSRKGCFESHRRLKKWVYDDFLISTVFSKFLELQ